MCQRISVGPVFARMVEYENSTVGRTLVISLPFGRILVLKCGKISQINELIVIVPDETRKNGVLTEATAWANTEWNG